MQPLRILHSEAAVAFGGQEHRVFKEMHAMRARGHHLEAVCQPHAQLVPRLRDAGFTVHTMPMGGLANYLKGVAAMRRILRDGRYDVVNTHSRIDTLIAGTAGRLFGVPLIVRTRHLANRAGSMLSYTWLPHRVTTVSETVRRNLVSRGVPEAHTATLYTPVVLPPPIEHSPLRGELGLAEDDIVVGCVAVMRAPKGHKDLVDAIYPLMEARPRLHMVFVGSGSPTFENIQAYIQQLGLEKRIHLMGTRRDVPSLLPGFDLFALATHQEASGTVYVEAQAAGLPVIGTDVGGVSEIMRDGVTGILVPAKNPPALRAALERLIDNPELRRKMGAAGRSMVWDEGIFSPARLAENTEAVYRKWLAERQA
ncbi:glycosyltransferase family 4 protein [Bordetella petrii]|uniref:glycosyltransferase family 4 protein n=1 Tax=Bordetella petrii TaxID=94624 RepID=UPI001E56386D|nr:glycosyltransferase family 4 protein [Bordetella petrii]MCD0502068.1 glycosyltransferase family 4 protein [Bordetella petrii]